MTDVFISYARRDIEFTRRLCEQLARANKDTWVDWEDIPLTAPNWWAEIQAGIEGADNFVFILSPESLASIPCQLELAHAFAMRKRVIPVVYQEVKAAARQAIFDQIAAYAPDAAMRERLAGIAPLALAESNWQRVSHINWVYFQPTDDFDAAFATLIQTVETDLEYVKAHTRYLTRAQEWERGGRPADLLLFGGEIARAEDWLRQAERYAVPEAQPTVALVNPLPEPTQIAYIAQSRAADRRRKRLARGAQVSIGVLIVALIAGGGIALGIISATQRQVDAVQATSAQNVAAAHTQVADANADLTAIAPTLSAFAVRVEQETGRVESLRLASLAQPLLTDPEGDQELAALINIAALQQADTEQAADSLMTALEQSYLDYRLTAHSGKIQAGALSPDGGMAITIGCRDPLCDNFDLGYEALLWDVATGEVLHTFTTDALLSMVKFSADGTTIFAGSFGGEVLAWDVATYAETVYRVNSDRPYTSGVEAISPDDRYVLADDFLWERQTGRVILTFPEAFANPFHNATFSPNGYYVVTSTCAESSEGGSCLRHAIRLWNTQSGALARVTSAGNASVTDFAFTADNRYFYSASADGTISQWSLMTGEQERVYEIGFPITRLSLSPDETRLAYTRDRAVYVLDLATGEPVVTLVGHTDMPRMLAFTPDGSRLVSAGWDGTALVWTLPAANQALFRLEALDGDVMEQAAFLPDNRYLAISTYRSFTLWDTHTRRYQRRDERFAPFVVVGDQLFGGDGANTLRLRNGVTGEVIREMPAGGTVTAVAATADGRFGVSSAGENRLIVWELATGTQRGTLDIDTRADQLAVSADAQQVIVGSYDGSLNAWDTTTGRKLFALSGHTDAILTVGFIDGDQRVLSVAADGTARLWDAATGAALNTYSLPEFEGYFTAALSRNETTLVVGGCQARGDNGFCSTGAVLRLDAATGAVLNDFSYFGNQVMAAALSADGRWVAAGMYNDATVHLQFADTSDLIAYACARVFRELTEGERVRYDIPDTAPVCP